MSPLEPVSRGPLARLWAWLPTVVDRRVQALAWLSVVLQVVLVGTGGAVRLTASGLGCPTWPNCSADSFVTTPALGYHGVIEFGNRMLTFVLSIVVILMFLVVLRMRRSRRDLWWLALVQALSIPFQAVLGGITVLTKLNPYVVGLHFVVSMALVALASALVYRTIRGARAAMCLAPLWFRIPVHVTSAFLAVTIVFGVLTTGSGPHAGDNSDTKALAPRNGLDPVALQHVHSIPAYITFGLTLLLLAATWIAQGRFGTILIRRFASVLLGVEILQIVVGITQAREGLPIGLVNIHLVLAALLVAAMTALTLSLHAVRESSD